MSELLNRFSFQAAKFNGQVFLACLGIWLLVLWCAISSILAQPFTPRQRRFWLAVVIFLPLIGLLAYLPFSFCREDLPSMFLMRHKDRPKRPGPRPTTSSGGSAA